MWISVDKPVLNLHAPAAVDKKGRKARLAHKLSTIQMALSRL